MSGLSTDVANWYQKHPHYLSVTVVSSLSRKLFVSFNSASIWISIFANHAYAMLYSQSVHNHISAIITLTPELNSDEIDRGSAQAFDDSFA